LHDRPVHFGLYLPIQTSMDWGAIASILAERSDRPIALLDKGGRIRMFNRAMEQILGWTRFHVDGQAWANACTPPDEHDEARRWINDALRGALRSYEAIGLTNSGGRISFRFEFSLVGRGSRQGLMMTATHAVPAQGLVGPLEGRTSTTKSRALQRSSARLRGSPPTASGSGCLSPRCGASP